MAERMTDDEVLKLCFQRTFSSPEGKTILYWLADECGVYETRPEAIKPDRISLFNKLMALGEVYHPGKAGDIVESILDLSRTKIEASEDEMEE